MTRLKVFKIVGLVALLSASSSASVTSATQSANRIALLLAIANGQENPAFHRDLLVANESEVLAILKTSVSYDPAIGVGQFLATLNFDWGNYDDAIFFADRVAANASNKEAILNIEYAARYSRGDCNVLQELMPRFPDAQKMPLYGQMRNVLFAHVSIEQRRRWLHHQLWTAPGRVYSFLNAFLTHPAYAPTAEEFDTDVSEIKRFFAFRSGLLLENLADVPSTVTTDYYVDRTDHYFYAALISMDLGAVCRRLGLKQESAIWDEHQRKAYALAEKADQLSEARRHRMEVTKKRLTVRE